MSVHACVLARGLHKVSENSRQAIVFVLVEPEAGLWLAHAKQDAATPVQKAAGLESGWLERVVRGSFLSVTQKFRAR